MKREAGEQSALDAAARRLDRAVGLLESRMSGMTAQAEIGGLFNHDRAQLAAELDAARGRERELQAAGQEAAQALDRAIAEIRSAIGDPGGDPGAHGEEA
jgi:hypothetical protein